MSYLVEFAPAYMAVCRMLMGRLPGHTDVVHAVEADHNGTEDSSVLYIPAVPLTERKCVTALSHAPLNLLCQLATMARYGWIDAVRC